MSSTAETGTAAPAADKPTFSEKEIKLLVAAIMSLKAGIPDLDYLRFQKNAGFNTLKTAQNTWSVLRKKIKEANPEAAAAAEAAAAGTPTTPKATPKKRTKKEADNGETVEDADEEGSTKKKARTPRKKNDSAEDEVEAEAADGSPKKKTPRSAKSKAAAAKKSEELVKEEDGEIATTDPEVANGIDKKADGAEAPKEKEKTPVGQDIKMEGSADD